MSTVLAVSRPVIRSGFRLQWEPAQARHVLLYPEGMVQLNQSATAILTRCDGTTTVAELIATLEREYSTQGLAEEIHAFLEHALSQRWLEMRT